MSANIAIDVYCGIILVALFPLCVLIVMYYAEPVSRFSSTLCFFNSRIFSDEQCATPLLNRAFHGILTSL